MLTPLAQQLMEEHCKSVQMGFLKNKLISVLQSLWSKPHWFLIHLTGLSCKSSLEFRIRDALNSFKTSQFTYKNVRIIAEHALMVGLSFNMVHLCVWHHALMVTLKIVPKPNAKNVITIVQHAHQPVRNALVVVLWRANTTFQIQQIQSVFKFVLRELLWTTQISSAILAMTVVSSARELPVIALNALRKIQRSTTNNQLHINACKTLNCKEKQTLKQVQFSPKQYFEHIFCLLNGLVP